MDVTALKRTVRPPAKPPFIAQPPVNTALDKPLCSQTYRLLDREDRDELASHYRTLTFRERLLRFDGGMSDAAVTAYVLGIAWERHWALAFVPLNRIVLAMEMVPHPRRNWAHIELAVSLPVTGCTPQAGAEMLQIALFAARDLGCHEFEMPICWAKVLLPSADCITAPPNRSEYSGTAKIDLDHWFDQRRSTPYLRGNSQIADRIP